MIIAVRMNDSRSLVDCNLAGTSLGFRFRNGQGLGLLPGCPRKGRRSHGAKMCLCQGACTSGHDPGYDYFQGYLLGSYHW